MLSKLKTLREKVIADYKNAPYRIVSDFKNEIAITKDYNSRQLLEMLQNADDANSTSVCIEMDTVNNILQICNKGQAFSYEGFESLMIPNYTSKTSGAFIGNKGLGFRSLLNWASEISVYSASCKVSFSAERARNVLYDEIEITPEVLLEMNERGGFSKNTVPFPIMASPEILAIDNVSEWTTIIEIIYDKIKYKDSITSQLQLITEEILLFLNHIEKIQIIIDGEVFKDIKRSKSDFDNHSVISVGEKKWTVFSEKADLPDYLQDLSKSYRQQYNIKIAFQDDLSDNYKQLFNFFPTKVNVYLPCILHGTFELNNSRDHLNDSDVNRFIIMQFENLFDKAVRHLKIKETNWLPYKLVTPLKEDSDSIIIPLLYNSLKEYSLREDIFPCLDGTYKKNGDYNFYGNEFNVFINTFFKKWFNNFLLPSELHFPLALMDINALKQVINEISKTSLSTDLRAQLIFHLSKIIGLYGKDYSLHFDILLNKENKIISSDDIAFTPFVNQGLGFEIPHKYVRMDILSSELYQNLNELYRNSYKKNEADARELQRSIRSICNLQPYDSSNIIDKIITSFRQYISDEISIYEKNIAVNVMVKALFSIYKNIDRKTEVLNQNILLLNLNSEFVEANTLYMAKSYSNEKIIEFCYDGYLNTKSFLKEISFWELDFEEIDEIESFFNWLGVNSFLRTEQISLSSKQEFKCYYDLINNEQSISSDFTLWRILPKTQVTAIKDFQQLVTKISKEKLLLLINFDAKTKRLVLENNENIEWSFSNSNRVIKTKISFINYQFIRSSIYADILLQSFNPDTQRFLNYNLLDYHLFSSYGIEKNILELLLSNLGAKKEFKELSVERIYQIIADMQNIDKEKNGKGTLTLYTKLIESLAENEVKKEDIQQYFPLRLFGKRGTDKDYFYENDIKYIANSIFSHQILQNIPLINLPKRYNENNILYYLGVSSLKESDIVIDKSSVELHNLNNHFTQEIEKYKPYILIYRLFSENLRKPINEESQRIDESILLKRLNIILVNSLNYNFEGKQYLLAPNDFISNKDNYYIHISENITSVSDIFKDSLLCDVLAEILCVQFKINDLSTDFRFVIKNDLNDTNHIVNKEFGDHQELINVLLGLPKPMMIFWNKVFEIAKIDNASIIFKNESELQSFIKSHLNLEVDVLKIDYVNCCNLDTYNLLILLCKRFNFSITKIRDNGLLEWHYKELIYCFNSKEKFIDSVIWESHSIKKDRQQNYIKNSRDIKSKIKSKLEIYLQTHSEERFKLEIIYDKILNDILISTLKEINVEFESLVNTPLVNPIILYSDLLSKYKIDKNELAIEVQSLLYFIDNEMLIEDFLKQNSDSENNNLDTNNRDFTKAKLKQGTKIKAPKTNSSSTKQNGNSYWNSKGSDEDNKRNLGKEAECVAYNALVNEYGIENVKWQSSNSDTPDRSDSLHYDILYKNSLNHWKKLEVKYYNGRYFKISKDELNLGISIPFEFEVGLVEGDELYIINDLFVFNKNEDVFNNERFKLESSNFTIHYTKEND